MKKETTEKRPDSVEAALQVTGETMPDFSNRSEEDQKHEKAQWIWKQIVKAINKIRDPKWEADYMKRDQRKYWPYSWGLTEDKSKRSGFSLSTSDYIYTGSNSSVGVRLLFASSDDVLYALKTFEQEYIESIIY